MAVLEMNPMYVLLQNKSRWDKMDEQWPVMR